jgi:hypothetical protein
MVCGTLFFLGLLSLLLELTVFHREVGPNLGKILATSPVMPFLGLETVISSKSKVEGQEWREQSALTRRSPLPPLQQEQRPRWR